MTTKLINPMPRKAPVSDLFLATDSADLKFTFDVENGTKILPAHKSILAQNSSVFRNMLFSSLPETEVTFNIVDASYEEFEEFLQFFYQDEITLTMQNIEGVLRLADKYDVTECSDMCAMFLESQCTLANLFLIYQLAVTFSFKELKKFCEDKIQHSTLEIFDSPAFLDYTRDMLNSILLMDGLACTESHIFDACIAWAKNSCRKNGLDETEALNLRQQLGDSLFLIRFRSMDGEEIVQIMTKANRLYAGMFSHKELVEVLCLRNVKDFKSENFCSKPRVNLSFKLNRNPVLICRGGDSHYGVIQKESEVFFRSTVPALLNDIQFLSIIQLSSLTFTIKINENNVPDVLFDGSMTYGPFDHFGPKISFQKTVVIKPNTIYRISIATEGIDGRMPDATIATVDTSQLMEGIPLTFVDDPSKPPTVRGGVPTSIVKALHFKQI